jgi:hypothetical protein
MKPGSAAIPKNINTGRSGATVPAGRVDKQAASDMRPQAAVDDPWSHYLRPSLPAANLARRTELAGIIRDALRRGEGHLDLRNVSPAALKALPGATLKALAPQVTGVALPTGLDALPRCLNRLTGLRSMEMAKCMARSIDVTPWNLDTLTITGVTELRWIAANEATSVSCPAPGIRRKICVNVYRDGKLQGHTAAGSRRYIKTPTRREVDRNGVYTMRDGQRAVCRHITTWWFGARAARRAEKLQGTTGPATDMYEVLRRRRTFRTAVFPDLHEQFYHALENATRNIMVGNDKFGVVIEKEFRNMRRGELPATRKFQVNSTTHAMGLELKVKSGRNGKPEYSLVFYDPNMSETHLRIKYHHYREARGLTVTSLLNSSHFSTAYFGDQLPVVTLCDLDSVQPGKKRSVALMLTDREKASSLALNLAMRDRFDLVAHKLIQDLRAMPDRTVDWKSVLGLESREPYFPPLSVALDLDLPNTAQSLADLAISLGAERVLEKTALFHFLQAPSVANTSPQTPLALACSFNQCTFINDLISAIVRPDADGLATAADYESLFTNGGADLPPPFANAIRARQIGAALSMVEGMLRLTAANRITRDQFVRLFTCRDENGVPAIEKVFRDGDAGLMLAVMQPLTSAATAHFSAGQLIAMLSVTHADGTPTLRAACEAGQVELLAAYGKLVLSAVASDRIRPLDAIPLLTAARRRETPCEALLAIAPRGEMLRKLDELLHDVRVAHWLPGDLSEALDALLTDDPADSLSSDFDTDSSESSSLS